MRGGWIMVAAALLGGCAGKPMRIECGAFAALLRDPPTSRVVDSISVDQHGPPPGPIPPLGIDDTDLVRHATMLLNSDSQFRNQILTQLSAAQSGALRIAEARTPDPAALAQQGGTLPTLLLSGGGQWGAFGAAFLDQAYRNNPDNLPRFGMVTGVSTGAMQALFVGQSNEPAERARNLAALVRAYAITSETDIVDRGGTLAAVTKGAIAQLDPLRARIMANLCPPGLADGGCPMAVQLAEGRGPVVLVGMVEAASGQFKYVSLNELASSQLNQPGGTRRQREHQAAECLAAAVLASSAMPVYYQQVMIGGQGQPYRTYVDGGVRNSVFLATMARLFSASVLNAAVAGLHSPLAVIHPASTVREAAAPAPGSRLAPGPSSIYMVRNGPTNARPDSQTDQPWSALDAAKRSYSLIVNQSEVSALAAVRLLQPTGSVYVITADGYDKGGWPGNGLAGRDPTAGPPCEKQSADAMFEPAFMRCLDSLGRMKAGIVRGTGPWIPVAEAGPAAP